MTTNGVGIRHALHGLALLGTLATSLLAAGASSAQPARDLEASTAAQFKRVRDDPAALAAFLDRMPLGGDLHHHIIGGARPAALVRMAAADGLCLPADLDVVWALQGPPCGQDQRPVAEAFEDTAFQHEIERRWSMGDFLADNASIDRIEANEHFFSIFGQLRLVQGNLSGLLAAARTLAARDGVIYLETATAYISDREARSGLAGSIRWDDDLPELRRTVLADPRFAEIRDATVEALPRELERSDRLLGCDSTAPDPGCHVLVRLQHTAIRTVEPVVVFVNLLLAYEIAAASPFVVGINFAGPETHPVSIRDYDLHMRMFGELADHYPNVKRSLHTGEMVDPLAATLGAERHIRLAQAPAEMGGAAAHRLGHAVALHADPEPARLLAEMRERGVVIEVNLESNRQLLGVSPLNHPLVDYLAAGVPVVLATDDPGLMLSDLPQQFALAARNEAVSYRTLKTFAINSIAYSFLPDAHRQRLLRRLEGDFAAFEATPWRTGGR